MRDGRGSESAKNDMSPLEALCSFLLRREEGTSVSSGGEEDTSVSSGGRRTPV